MDTKEIAEKLVAFCRAGETDQIRDTLYSDDIVSIEPGMPAGMDPVFRGKAALAGKGQWWRDNHEMTGATVEGPFVHGDQFIVKFAMDVKVKATGEAMHVKDAGLYTVKDGKVVEERFFALHD